MQTLDDSAQSTTIRQFASCEHLSHIVAYELTKLYDGVSDAHISVYDDDGIIREYKVTRIVSSNLGLHGHILTGQDLDNPRVHIVFQGTKDLNGWSRDFEDRAPGYESFQQNVTTIIEMLHTILGQITSNNISLYISGHSLGGSDAQYCTNAIFIALSQELQKKSKAASLTKIKNITLNHVNSAGVANKCAVESNLHAEYLAKEHNIKIAARVIRVAGDPIQKTGEANILANVSPEIAQVTLLKIKSGYDGWLNKTHLAGVAVAAVANPLLGLLAGISLIGITSRSGFKAHTEHHFHAKQMHEINYDILDNSTSEGREQINKKLTNQASVVNSRAAKYAKSFLYAYCSPSPPPADIEEVNEWLDSDQTAHYTLAMDFLQRHNFNAELMHINSSDAVTFYTPLTKAIKMQDLDVCKALVACGASINQANSLCNTPLHIAADTGNEEIVRWLLEQGADCTSINRNRFTALDLVRKSNFKIAVLIFLAKYNFSLDPLQINLPNDSLYTPLTKAVKLGDFDLAIELINTFNADVNAKNGCGNTPLHMAIDNNHEILRLLLLDLGADLDIANNQAVTPAMLSAKARLRM